MSELVGHNWDRDYTAVFADLLSRKGINFVAD